MSIKIFHHPLKKIIFATTTKKPGYGTFNSFNLFSLKPLKNMVLNFCTKNKLKLYAVYYCIFLRFTFFLSTAPLLINILNLK